MKKQSEKERAINKAENAVQEFMRFLDELFFEGYAQQLASEYPQEFTAQYNEFFDNYYAN